MRMLGVDAGNLAQLRVSPMSRELGGSPNTKPLSGIQMKRVPIGTPTAYPRSFKKGGKVRKGGVAKLHKGEQVMSKQKYSAAKAILSGSKKSKTEKLIKAAGKEIKNNPPSILVKTAKKSGTAQMKRQKVAIMLSKARANGADLPRK